LRSQHHGASGNEGRRRFLIAVRIANRICHDLVFPNNRFP
jgi:hypothetical protein